MKQILEWSSPLLLSLQELQGYHDVLNMRIRLHRCSNGKGCCPSGLNLRILSLCNKVEVARLHILWDFLGTAVCLAHFSVVCVSFPSPWQEARNVDFYFGWACQSEVSLWPFGPSAFGPVVVMAESHHHGGSCSPPGDWGRERRGWKPGESQSSLKICAPKEPLPPTTPPAETKPSTQ